MSFATEPGDFSENRVLLQIQARRKEQTRSFWTDLLAVFAIVLIAILGVTPFFLIQNIETALGFFYFAAGFIILLAVTLPIWLIKMCLIFWPFVFFWLGCLKTFRQQEFLSVLQTSVETQTPLGQMVRAYAMTKSGGYRQQLTGFADCIDRGLTLQQALTIHQGLLRYDVLGMLVVGTNDKKTEGRETNSREMEMVDTLEQMKSHHGIPGIFVSNTITRLIYLGVICLQMFWVVTFLMLWIVPQFQKIFDDFGLPLPVMTRSLIDVCEFLKVFWFLLAPFVMVAGAVLILYLLMQSGFVSARPFGLRRMFRSVDAARFLRVLGTGVKCNRPLPKILSVYSNIVDSFYLKEKAKRISRKIQSSGLWLEQLRRGKIINRGEARLLETAERTGNLGNVLHELAGSKERKQLVYDDLASKLFFVLLILITGAVVGFLVIAMFLPIIQLITTLSFVR
ncbi:MAG: type II secretion system F family protein [Planctomycetaceae bacterium]|nr:type II secretion system F family protein [Planctomycetaceae bacterium]